MIDFQILKKVSAILIFSVALFIATASRGESSDNLVVEKHDDSFSIQARQIPLLRLLSELGGQTGANFFIAETISSQPVDVTCMDVSLSKALQCILKGFDFVASFSKTASGGDEISSVKIYPKGNRHGNLIKVAVKESNPQVLMLGRIAPRPVAIKGEGLLTRDSLVMPGHALPQFHSVIPSGAAMTAKRDVDQQLEFHQQAIAADEWRIQHASPVVLSGPNNTTVSASSAPPETASDENYSKEEKTFDNKTKPNGAASNETTTLATPLLADVVSDEAHTEAMKVDVNAGMDRLQFLQQNDAQSFVVTLMDGTASH